MRILVHYSASAERILARLFWKRDARRRWVAFAAEIDGASARLESAPPLARWTAKRASEIRKDFRRVRARAERVQILQRQGAHDQEMNNIRQAFRPMLRIAEGLLQSDRRWHLSATELRRQIDELRGRAQAIPGRQFEEEFSRLFDACRREIDRAPKGNSPNEIDSHLKSAKLGSERLEILVRTAEEARVGIEELEAGVAAISPAHAAAEAATRELYDTIRDNVHRIRGFLRAGNYPAAAHVLEASNRYRHELAQSIERRYAYAREEIDLWLSMESIAKRFNLARFPAQLTAEQIQEWHEIRPRIEDEVLERAAAVRKENGRLLSFDDPRLNLKFEKNKKRKMPLEHLLKFAQASAVLLAQRLPGEDSR